MVWFMASFEASIGTGTGMGTAGAAAASVPRRLIVAMAAIAREPELTAPASRPPSTPARARAVRAWPR